MKIIIESPKDRFLQFMAWIDEQPAGEPVVGTGETPEESLEDLRITLQNLIEGKYDDENDLVLANSLLPELFDEEFQIFVESGIIPNKPLYFNLDFDNYIFPENR